MSQSGASSLAVVSFDFASAASPSTLRFPPTTVTSGTAGSFFSAFVSGLSSGFAVGFSCGWAAELSCSAPSIVGETVITAMARIAKGRVLIRSSPRLSPARSSDGTVGPRIVRGVPPPVVRQAAGRFVEADLLASLDLYDPAVVDHELDRAVAE